MTIELLAPAGSMANLKAAVQKGADAVYLGMQRFSARNYATNFNESYFKQALKICKSNNVKTFLTMNTLVKNNELVPFFNQLSFAYSEGIDSVIIQQTSFIDEIKKYFPDLKIHISTQAGVMNSVHANILNKADRINLARELSRKEIEEIRKNYSKELEIFCHGALCSSISGNCLFSSLIGGRSGNRGKCAQPCRKRYNNKFLLSTKELCLIDQIPYIINMGINSIKIEGRMRNPSYVATVTSAYREAIDSYISQGSVSIKDETLLALKNVFTRDFTKGRYLGQDVFNFLKSDAYTKSSNETYSVNVNNNLNYARDKPLFKLPHISSKKSYNKKLLFRAYSEKDAAIAYDNGADIVYFDIFSDSFLKIKKDFKDKLLYGITPRIMLDKDFSVIKNTINKCKPDGLFAGNISAVKFNLPTHFDYNLNFFNDIDIMRSRGFPIISPELSLHDLKLFNNKNFAVMVHGKIKIMTLFHNINGILKDDFGNLFHAEKIYNGSQIINDKELGLFRKSKQLLDLGINNFYVDTNKNVRKIISFYNSILNGNSPNDSNLRRGYTVGWSIKGVQ
jgi:collagenase-like PrtC family protease